MIQDEGWYFRDIGNVVVILMMYYDVTERED